jgi:phosphoglycerol transferase MdoB-like AlkP superfamily enzyme
MFMCFANMDNWAGVENKGYLFFKTFIIGLQFDNFIASYIVLLPLILLSVFSFFNKIPGIPVTGCNVFFIVLYSISFVIAIADIPYFSYFFTHLDASALEWFEFGGTTAGLIFQEKTYYPYFIMAVISILLFSAGIVYYGRKLRKAVTVDASKRNYKIRVLIPAIILIWCICVTGMRGSFQRYPLRAGYAYFSNNAFFNRLGINPVFYFLKSYSANKKQKNSVNDLMSVETAIRLVQKETGTVESDGKYSVSRQIEATGPAKNANVVIILLESMSMNCLQYEYEGKNLTPYINELVSKSYFFENFYSSGIHTNNGIVSTLYAMPALFNKPMTETKRDYYTGLPYYLHQYGYQNLFFVTSNPNYDHMNSFLLDNSFDRIYSLYDYPAEKRVNNFGVQDDFMFEYGIGKLNEAAKTGKPFMATFLTVSNHPPLIVPERFRNCGDTDEKRILAFVDNSLGEFIESASRETWFQNTIFVVLGDHGSGINAGRQKYDMPISHNHIPCIIYSPAIDGMPQKFRQYGGQIDIFPTIMGLLNMSYTNNTMGIDLLKEEARSKMFFASDSHLGCISDKYFYVRNLTGNSDFLYDLHGGQVENLSEKLPDIMDSMKNYAVSMMVTADYLINK